MRVPVVGAVIAVVLEAVPAAAAPNGDYKGRTKDGLRVLVQVVGSRVVHMRFVARSCDDQHPIDLGDQHLRIGRSGRLSMKLTEVWCGFELAGRFRGRRVTGTFRERRPGESGASCDTGRVHFTARHV